MKKVLVTAFTLLVTLNQPIHAGRWSHFLANQSVSSAIYDTETQTYWFGTFKSTVWQFDGLEFESLILPRVIDQKIIYQTGQPLQVTALAFDKREAKLWIGTKKGLYLYHISSKKWDYFDTESGLSKIQILALFLDENGPLWYGSKKGSKGGGLGKIDQEDSFKYTKDGCFKWNPETADWDSIPGWQPIPGDSKKRDVFISIARDQHKLYLGTDGAGLYTLNDNGDWEHPDLDLNFVNAIAIDRAGNKWLGTGRGVFMLNADDSPPDYYPQSESGLVQKDVHTIWIEPFHNGDLKWFGTCGGVSVLDSTNKQWKTFTNENSGLAFNEVRTIIGDDDGNLWFGVIQARGVSKLDRNWSEQTVADGLHSNFIFALEKDNQGRLWVGPDRTFRNSNPQAGGVQILDVGHWRVLPIENIGCVPQVTDFSPYKSQMWIATIGCGILVVSDTLEVIDRITSKNANGFPSKNVSSLQIVNDTLWAGTDSGLVRLLISDENIIVDSTFNMSTTPIPSDVVTTLDYDFNSGTLWVGTNQGLALFDGETWNKKEVAELPSDITINTIERVSAEEVWIGTNFGVARYETLGWTLFSTSDGLPSEIISSIAVTKEGEIWCGTLNGAASYSRGRWTKYTTDDGLSDNFVLDVYSDNSNVVWFATWGGGISRYRKTNLRPDTFFNKTFDVVTDPNVTFRYSGFDFNTPTPNLRYEYALDDRSMWNLTFNNYVTLFLDEDGPHTFYVRAVDKDGNVDSSEAVLTFTKVQPQQGGAVEIVDNVRVQKYGSLWLYVPPNSIQEGNSITVTAIDSASIDMGYDEKLRFTGIAYELSPPDLLDKDKKNKPLTLKIFYRDQIAQDFDEQKLRVYRLDLDNDNTWTLVGGSLDKDSMAVTTTINTLGTYALFEDQRDLGVPDRSLEIVSAQPRIFSPGGRNFLGKVTISFDLGEPTEVTAKVYNLSGRLVQVLCENHPMNAGRNVVEWNGQDRTSSYCPSGLYIVTVQASGQLATKTVMVNNQ